MNKLFGIDVSRHQGTVRWSAVATKSHPYKVLFAGIRTTISWGYVDPQAERNIKEALDHGIKPIPYWVAYPNEDPKRQVDHLYNTLIKWGIDIKTIYTAPDVELGTGHHSCTPKHFQSFLLNALVYSTTISGNKPIIYSRASFIDHYITGPWYNTPPKWYNNYDWWLAQYLNSGEEHPGPVRLARGMNRARVLIHQTSDKGPGKTFGMESYALDMNRYQFNKEHFNYYFDFGATPPVVEPTLEERVDDLETRVSILEAA